MQTQYTMQELRNEFLILHNEDSTSTDTTKLASANMRINELQARIAYRKSYEWRKRTFYMTTVAPYETGTITVTQNSKVITGSGTTWTLAHRIGYLLVDGNTFKLARFSSTTQYYLEAPYPGDTESGKTYKFIFPDAYLDPEISSIINVKVAGRDIDVSSRDKLVKALGNPGTPDECAISERGKEDWYNTGTVAVTINSPTVTGTGTAYTAEMEGMGFRVNEFSKLYKIKSINLATQVITLYENYEGTTGSGKSFSISPVGTPLITFRAAPDDYYSVEIEALIFLPKLVSDTAYSLIPNHAPMIAGVRWLSHDLKNENPVRIEQLAAEFRRSLTDLDSAYKAISNVKWISNEELKYKKLQVGQINPF